MAKAKAEVPVKKEAPIRRVKEKVEMTEDRAMKIISAVCKIDKNGTITVPAKGIGMRKLAAIDFIKKFFRQKYMVVFEHVSEHSNFIPRDKRGKIIFGRG